jgi:hypothetical protein
VMLATVELMVYFGVGWPTISDDLY